MIIEDQVDRRMGWMGRVEKLEELDELAASVVILDQSVNLASQQIDAGQQGDRAVSLVLTGKVACAPGAGGKFGAVVAIASTPGFSS